MTAFAEGFPSPKGKTSQQTTSMACVVHMCAFRTQQGQQTAASKEGNKRLAAAPRPGQPAEQAENGEKSGRKPQGDIGGRAEKHGQRIACRSTQDCQQADASYPQPTRRDSKSGGGKKKVAVKMDGIGMQEKRRQTAVALVIDIEAGTVEASQAFPKSGGWQGRDGREKVSTAGVYKHQGKHGERGPLPAPADVWGRGRGAIVPAAFFFLIVKVKFKERDIAYQGGDKTVCCAVGFPDAEGQTARREEKNPCLLLLIGGKTLRRGKAYPERGKEA